MAKHACCIDDGPCLLQHVAAVRVHGMACVRCCFACCGRCGCHGLHVYYMHCSAGHSVRQYRAMQRGVQEQYQRRELVPGNVCTIITEESIRREVSLSSAVPCRGSVLRRALHASAKTAWRATCATTSSTLSCIQ